MIIVILEKNCACDFGNIGFCRTLAACLKRAENIIFFRCVFLVIDDFQRVQELWAFFVLTSFACSRSMFIINVYFCERQMYRMLHERMEHLIQSNIL